ncbi:MAG TPA: glycerophosphodiester phosphodiesterase, partial [Candidatus Binataceae bacterium]|nr:glycerophosphodiester phosphodiesterase [Candidatus Binataceae bacterium]
LNVELKGAGTAAAVCELIITYNAAGTALVSSFDWAMLVSVRQIDPRIRIGLLAKDQPKLLIDAASAMNANAINPRVDMVDRGLCTAAHARGLKLYAWTCDDPRRMGKLIADGADGIMTNYPDRLKAVLTD